MTIKELSEKRVKLVADARKILDLAQGENREMKQEEVNQYDGIMKDVDELREKIDGLVAQEKREQRMREEDAWAKESAGRKTGTTQPGEKTGSEKREIVWGEKWTSERRMVLHGHRATDEYRAAYGQWIAYGPEGLNRDEYRALQADSPTIGGYIDSPMQMVAELVKFVDNEVFMRRKARVFTVASAKGLGVPSLDTDVDDADWTAELGTGNEDSAMALGKRELHPHPLAKRIKVSNTLLRTATMNPENLVRDRLAYKFGVSMEKGYLTGSGAQQPLGVFTASSLGISTGRDVSTDNTTTEIRGDNLFNVKYSLKPQYQSRAEWIFHRDAVKQIRKLKDGEGRYIWQPGFTGTPDTLLDRPINQSEYAPNTFTTGLYVGILGVFDFYWIADVSSLQIQRLVELYAATNQTGFIGRLETDGMPVLEEAFARVKLG